MGNYKEKVTKGRASIDSEKSAVVRLGLVSIEQIVRGDLLKAAKINSFDEVYIQGDANALLITEAFNVLSESGFTPRELLEQRDELVLVLKGLLQIHTDPTFGDTVWRLAVVEKAEATIQTTKTK